MEWLQQIDPTGQLTLIGIAIALGALVGLRREMELQQQGVPGFVGFRTMPLIVLLGCLTTFFPLFPYMPIVGFVAIILFLLIAYYNGVFQLQLLGLTSEISTLIMFMVGILVGYGYIMQGILITIFIAGCSAFKGQIHMFAKTISPQEWAGALHLLIISAIVLPVLPREAIDPWGAISLYEVWLVVIFISSIGFVGYFLNKYFGNTKGTLATSLVGALVSSTVVTTHLAAEGKYNDQKNDILTLGIVIAIATMLARVGFVIAVLSPREFIVQLLVIPIVMLAPVVIMGIYWYMKNNSTEQSLPDSTQSDYLRSPFELIPAMQFAALFVVILLGIRLGEIYFGSYGVIATTFFSAFADVDASIVSILQVLQHGEIELHLVSLVVVIALIVNTMIKAVYVGYISRNRQLTLRVLAVTTLASLTAVATYLVI